MSCGGCVPGTVFQQPGGVFPIKNGQNLTDRHAQGPADRFRADGQVALRWRLKIGFQPVVLVAPPRHGAESTDPSLKAIGAVAGGEWSGTGQDVSAVHPAGLLSLPAVQLASGDELVLHELVEGVPALVCLERGGAVRKHHQPPAQDELVNLLRLTKQGAPASPA